MDASFLQTFLQKYGHLKIKLEDIITATNNFDDQNNRIGVGGFGNVYKGEVSHFKGRSMVAIKRLDPKFGQGIPEFLKEISMLSSYRHENLISLLGFCCEAKEMILVYEFASGGSLDRHLNSPHLTWTQRVKICLDAAKGLSYLHDPRERHQRLIHCDIKSGNILLDDQWNAKISDFGLSIMGSANEQQSVIVTLAAGTEGYIDPVYRMTHTLTKESDVYSFGVVLFEVLCGTSCCTYSNQRVEKNFVATWVQSYEKEEVNNIIFKNLNIQPMDQDVLAKISNIAHRCLKVSREDRPNMAEVVAELETALELQDYSENKDGFFYKEIVKSAQPPLEYNSIGELVKMLSKGVLLNGGKTWFSFNKRGEHCEMISFGECLDSGPDITNLRFVARPYPFENRSAESEPSKENEWILKTHVKAQFLSLGIAYTVYLVFKFQDINPPRYISLNYKLKGETKTSVSYPVFKRKDGWYMVELYQFISEQRTVNLEILFGAYHDDIKVISVQGIEFCPSEKVQHKDEKHSMSDLDANWEGKLVSDFKDMQIWSKIRHRSTMKYAFKKNGKKCHIMSARGCSVAEQSEGRMISLPDHESRFGEAFECNGRLYMHTVTPPDLLSMETRYEIYLVYKLPKDQSTIDGPMYCISMNHWFDFYLVHPSTPVIRQNADQYTHSPVNYMKGTNYVPQQRDDGWMETIIWEFDTNEGLIYPRDQTFQFESYIREKSLSGLIVQGLEYRPYTPGPSIPDDSPFVPIWFTEKI